MPLRRPGRVEFFNDCVTSALSAIRATAPDALNDVIVGVEDVPHLNVAWSGDRVPLSAAVESSKAHKAQVIIFQRPLELRASSRAHLRRLVHRTIVEQLGTLTGRSLEELAGGEVDWDEDY